jgi:hypothetical protein
MKSRWFAMLMVAITSLLPLRGEDDTPLPFPVKVGGQAASHQKGQAFATVAAPVAVGAELEVQAKGDPIIVNIVKVDAKGEPDRAEPPLILLLQGTNKTTLDKTMDGRKPAAGKYLLSISAAERTASILFTVK